MSVTQICSHVTSFERLRTNALGEFGLDEGLVEHLRAATKYIDVAAGTYCLHERAEVKLVLGHWASS